MGSLSGTLVVLCVITYFLCGLFKIPGVTYDNFQKGLLYIVRIRLKTGGRIGQELFWGSYFSGG